jgi:uncharacterized protein YjbI with pentapeptide repeats
VANEEHVKRLKQGVAEWNAWREGKDLSDINLSDAHLRGANLIGANLGGANLGGSQLSRANLNRANLNGANLSDARLSGADLSRADLSRASLNGADLSRADLGGANLSDANLSGAQLPSAGLTRTNLSRANLTKTTYADTVFCDLDLTDVIGLETCIHLGPSIIDHRTLQRSGQLPLSFLRGVGLPEKLIEYLPSLLEQAIQFYSCFISYSSRDQDFADRIHADLQNKGVRCWFAPHDMPIGGKILDTIDEAIRLRDKVLLILSEHSIKSDWVEDEVTKGFAEERRRGHTVLFPVRLDDAVMDTGEAWAVKLRDQRNIGDFRRWKDHAGYKRSFERVLRDLKRAAETEE